MQLASVLLARAYAVFQIEDLNPNGTVYYPEIATALVGRYGFQKYPSKPEEFDESKGIEFHDGRLRETVINKLVILNRGIYVDTGASTDVSEDILRDMLEWGETNFGFAFSPDMLKKRAYVSNITFHSEVNLVELHPALREICAVVTQQVEENFGRKLIYEPEAVQLQFDNLTTNFGTAAFLIQRREGVAFSENKYFSASPLKTKIHIALIEALEKQLSPKASPSLP
jgi:hypothetical protein